MDEGKITRKDLVDAFRAQDEEAGNLFDAKNSMDKMPRYSAKYKVFNISVDSEREELEKIYSESFNRTDLIILDKQTHWDKSGEHRVALFWAEEKK